MNTALTYIAESVVKAVGVAGIEAMAMKAAIYAIWKPLAEELAEEVIETCFDYANEDIRDEYVDAIYQRYRTKMTEDFVEVAAPYVEEYAGYAWDRGREDAFGYALSGLLEIQKSEKFVEYYDRPEYAEPFPNYYYGQGRTSSRIADRLWERHEINYFQKDQESIITDLVTVTGSTKANVQRTVKRWFTTTQGQYFDRFIVPETARLLSYEEGASLRSIGMKYKEFVKAEGYWSSVSEFNSESSKIFSQVQALHEMNVRSYTIESVLDDRTCDVCQFMNGSTWSVEEAVTKVYDMLISEADEAASINPFPPRSTPTDFDDPRESPYNLPPYHPRCRCSVRSTSRIVAMPQEILARPFDVGPRPTNKILTKVLSQYVDPPSKREVQALIDASGIPGTSRSLTRAERQILADAWDSVPLEEKKWAIRNKTNFQIFVEDGEDIVSRVEGEKIFINSKYFDKQRYGPDAIQHELRHALVNPQVVSARGGGNTVWRELTDAAGDTKKGWRSPTHVNSVYQLNGNRGIVAANAASDEFLAVIGDHYRKGMSMDELITSVRHKDYGIDVSDKITSTVVSSSSRWSAREAKNAVEYWWYTMDIDNSTLLSKKQMLAKLTHKPSTAQVRAVAIRNEVDLRDNLRIAGIKDVYQEGDNAPFDVWVGADPEKWYSGASKKKPTHVIEVKTIVRGKNNKITMHTESLARKKKEARKFGKKNTQVHTVVFDERNGKYYYKEGVGSFRLNSMKEVTIDDLQEIFGGKATAGTRQVAASTERLSEIRSASPKLQTRKASNLKTQGTIADGNVNEVRIVTVGKGKKKYIFKPINGETYWTNDKYLMQTIDEVNEHFNTNFVKFNQLQPEHWEWVEEEFGDVAEDFMVRRTIQNHNISLAQREAFSLDVAHRLGFDNENAIIPKFMLAEDTDGNIAGVLVEYITNSEVESVWQGMKMTDEQTFQMAVFDYLIGNADRHDQNWMRKIHTGRVTPRTRRTGTPVYIDHGYVMPGQLMDSGGISEWRCHAAQYFYEGIEYDLDPDWMQDMAVRIQTFVDKDATTLARSYGFDAEEIDALLRRGDSLAERLRGGNFSSVVMKHWEDGAYGAEDSYIGG
jgi:hypothetical protein